MKAKKKQHEAIWIRQLKDHLISLCLSTEHEKLAGFRVVRVLRAKWDKQHHRIVHVVGRAFGGGSDNRGYNGKIVEVDRPDAGSPALDWIVSGPHGITSPVDEYVARIRRERVPVVPEVVKQPPKRRAKPMTHIKFKKPVKLTRGPAAASADAISAKVAHLITVNNDPFFD